MDPSRARYIYEIFSLRYNFGDAKSEKLFVVWCEKIEKENGTSHLLNLFRYVQASATPNRKQLGEEKTAHFIGFCFLSLSTQTQVNEMKKDGMELRGARLT
jgi:hypothetical protein